MTENNSRFVFGRAITVMCVALLLVLGGCASALHQGRAGTPVRGSAVSPDADARSSRTMRPAPGQETGETGGDTGAPGGEPVYEEDEDVSFLAKVQEEGLEAEPFKNLPEESNERVEYFVRYFQGPKNAWFCRALSRSGRYLPQMKEIFREEGLPEDLVYLALIESGFNPYAYSCARAMGIWQFIAGTGQRYGLVIDNWMDERRDLEKSTRAAARYLRDLHELFNDWYIAAAAYNAGERKLQAAIDMYDSNNFWHLSKQGFLKQETKNYVPLFLAAMTIAKDPERYGFGHVQLEPPLLYETATINYPMELTVIAEGCGHDLAKLRSLNPQLRYGCTPPRYLATYEIKIPLGSKARFLAFCDQLPPEKRFALRYYRTHKGDTVLRVASQYGIPADSLRELNSLGRRNRLPAGMNLVLPPAAGWTATAGVSPETNPRVARAAVTRNAPENSHPGTRKLIYVVKKGDCLTDIGRRYQVSVDSLRGWNRLAKSRTLCAGQNLVIWKEAPAPAETRTARAEKPAPQAREAEPRQAPRLVHVVKKGETLWSISRAYGVDLPSLLAWNGLNKSSGVQAGQTLLVQREEAGSARATFKEAAATTETFPKAQQEVWYTVRAGDTLFRIARKYGVTTAQLSAWNNLKDRSTLHAGMRLRILTTTQLEAKAGRPVAEARPD
jgi:membrane-bound lytic murein transglycosylase D